MTFISDFDVQLVELNTVCVINDHPAMAKLFVLPVPQDILYVFVHNSPKARHIFMILKRKLDEGLNVRRLQALDVAYPTLVLKERGEVCWVTQSLDGLLLLLVIFEDPG